MTALLSAENHVTTEKEILMDANLNVLAQDEAGNVMEGMIILLQFALQYAEMA